MKYVARSPNGDVTVTERKVGGKVGVKHGGLSGRKSRSKAR